MKVMCLFLLLAAHVCFAQSDSIVVKQTKWTTTRIAPGIVLKEFAFTNLFSSNQYVALLEVKQRKRNHLDLAADKKMLSTTSTFGESEKAIAALNGTFFDITNGGSIDYVRSDGMEVNSTRPDSKGKRSSHQKSAVIIDNGKLSIVKWDGTVGWEENIKGKDVMVSGPLLVWNKINSPLDTGSLEKMRHPRTAVAKAGNRILYVTVDGRNDLAAGMTLTELANFLRWMNAAEAINLDGGGSTTLWVDSKKVKGVVNHPSDNKKWDHEGQRKVANVLIVKRH